MILPTRYSVTTQSVFNGRCSPCSLQAPPTGMRIVCNRSIACSACGQVRPSMRRPSGSDVVDIAGFFPSAHHCASNLKKNGARLTPVHHPYKILSPLILLSPFHLLLSRRSRCTNSHHFMQHGPVAPFAVVSP